MHMTHNVTRSLAITVNRQLLVMVFMMVFITFEPLFDISMSDLALLILSADSVVER